MHQPLEHTHQLNFLIDRVRGLLETKNQIMDLYEDAVLKLRYSGLWEEEYESWEQFCRDVFDMPEREAELLSQICSAHRAHRLQGVNSAAMAQRTVGSYLKERKDEIGENFFEFGKVYFLQSHQTRLIKIGWCNLGIQERARELQTGNGLPLEVIGWKQGPKQLESDLHRKFQYFRVRGEWFKPEQMLVSWIANNCVKPVTEEEREAHGEDLDAFRGLGVEEFREWRQEYLARV